MAELALQPLVTRPEILRWGVCASVALAAHVLAAVAITAHLDGRNRTPARRW